MPKKTIPSEIRIDDSEKIFVDESGRSVGFFCKRLPARVHCDLITELVNESEKRGGRNVRLCLHNEPEALIHNMIIVERKGKYYCPHKHIEKGE